jgi:hypothetical protein
MPVRLDTEVRSSAWRFSRLRRGKSSEPMALTFDNSRSREEQGSRGIFDIGKPAATASSNPWRHRSGDSKEYVLNVLDPGTADRKITNPMIPFRLHQDQCAKERYADAIRAGMKIEFRSHLPAFAGLFADEAGRILAKTYERVETGKDAFYFDVFDPQGRFSAKVPNGEPDRHGGRTASSIRRRRILRGRPSSKDTK